MMEFVSDGCEIFKYKKKGDPSKRWINVTKSGRFAWKAARDDEFDRNRSCFLGLFILYILSFFFLFVRSFLLLSLTLDSLALLCFVFIVVLK